MKIIPSANSWSYSGLRALAALAFEFGLSPRANPALGDDVSAVAADQARLRASLHIRPQSKYTVYELTMPTGGKIQHFVEDSRKIFAVSCSGGWRPNLRDLLQANIPLPSHGGRNLSLPYGMRASLDARAGTLVGLESAVG